VSEIEPSAELALLEAGSLVPFRVLQEEVIPGVDPGEFGVRIELEIHDDEEEQEAAEIVEWGAFGFLFVLAVLSFADARPRGHSQPEYREGDQFSIVDYLDCLSFRRGELHFDADYVRGRRLKTSITIRPNGTVRLRTLGRGRSASHWLERLQGNGKMRPV
jgi:hypothetical protein